jgi:hypothetical protein
MPLGEMADPAMARGEMADPAMALGEMVDPASAAFDARLAAAIAAPGRSP